MALRNCTAYALGTNSVSMTFNTDSLPVQYTFKVTALAGVQLGEKNGQAALIIYPSSVIDNTIAIVNSDLVALGTTASAAYTALVAKLNA
jgi:hypothetical protein